jgi:hypothetical protein
MSVLCAAVTAVTAVAGRANQSMALSRLYRDRFIVGIT